MSEPTDAELHEAAERAAEWARSPEGQAALEEALRRAEAASEKMRQAQRVDWWRLHEPVTI